jgi:UDP-N-acetylglucosamine acyltransferase
MGGYVTIEDWSIVGGGTVIHQFVRIGRHCMIGGGSRIPQDVAPFIKLAGSPPRLAGINAVGLERRGFSRPTRDALQQAYRILFRSQLTVEQAVRQLRDTLGNVPEVEVLARFAETSARGLTR